MNSKAMNPWALVWPCLCVLSCSRGSGDGAEASQPEPEVGHSSSERHAILWFVPENLATNVEPAVQPTVELIDRGGYGSIDAAKLAAVPDAVELVTWPDLSAVSVAKNLEETPNALNATVGTLAKVLLAPSDVLAEGWYAFAVDPARLPDNIQMERVLGRAELPDGRITIRFHVGSRPIIKYVVFDLPDEPGATLPIGVSMGLSEAMAAPQEPPFVIEQQDSQCTGEASLGVRDASGMIDYTVMTWYRFVCAQLDVSSELTLRATDAAVAKSGLPLRGLDGQPFEITVVPKELHAGNTGGGWTYVP